MRKRYHTGQEAALQGEPNRPQVTLLLTLLFQLVFEILLFEQLICSVFSPNDLFHTTVRKSIRGKKAAASNKAQEEQEADDDPPASPLRPHSLINAEEVEVDEQVNADAAPGGQEVQENQLLDSCLEGGEEKEASKRANIKGPKE